MDDQKRLRFSVVPKSTTIEVERPNAFRASDDDPETMVVELTAWPAGPQCPVWVEIAVEAAHDAYRAALREEMARRERDGQNETDPETGQHTYTGPTHLLSQILVDYRCDLLCAVVEGLDRKEAAIWARHGGAWEDVLVELGRWQRATPDEPPPESDSEGEAVGEAATAPSSPASASSTGRTTGKR